MIIKLEIRDRSFNIRETLENEVMGLSWEALRVGGCGSINFDLPREYCNERLIGGDFNLRLYGRNPSTKAYDLWYQGIVERKSPNVRGQNETISVQGQGYQAQLQRIQLVDLLYTSTEISDIVKDLLDNYIVPATDITYDPGDIEVTDFTPDSIPFNTDASNAMQTLADLVGTREWGVDRNRKFYFKARSSTQGLTFVLGGKTTVFSDDYSFKDIVNRVIIQGGDVAGTPFRPDPTTAPYNDAPSQLKYGRHDLIYQNSSIVTDEVAERFAQSILTEKSRVIRRARFETANYDTLIEATTPIPLFRMKARNILYGERKYGTSLYSGVILYQVNRISYRLEDQTGVLTTGMDLGQPRPVLAEQIGQLQYQLEQLRGARL